MGLHFSERQMAFFERITSAASEEERIKARDAYEQPEAFTMNQFILSWRQALKMCLDRPDDFKEFNQILDDPFVIDGTRYFQDIVHYGKYLDMLLKDRNADGYDVIIDELQETVANPVDAVTDTNSSDPTLYLFNKLATRMNKGLAKTAIPQMCLVSGHLFGEGNNLPTLIEGWYQDMLENLGIAQKNMDAYIAKLRSRIGQSENVVDSFLQDFQYDITSFNAACLNLATISAIHSQTEDCAVYVGTTPYTFTGDSKKMRRKMKELLTFPVYAKYNKDLQVNGGVVERDVDIPTYISVVDVEEFVKIWKQLWEQALRSVESSCNSSLNHFCRPLANADGQARIKWNLQLQRQSFNIRIDQETNACGHLSIDIGKAEWRDAFAYAQEVGEQSTKQEVVMNYSAILDQRGGHSHVLDPHNPLPRSAEFYYPSVMKSAGITDINQRMALVASVILQQGKGLGLSLGHTFGYHYRDGAMDQPKNRQNFETIVRRFQTLVPRT